MINIQNYRKDHDLGEYGAEVTKNGCGYFTDLISEIATLNCGGTIPYLLDFLKNEVDWVEKAIDEIGWSRLDRSLYAAAEAGERMKIEADLYENLDNIIIDYALQRLQEQGIEKIDNDFLDELTSYANGFEAVEEVDDFVSDYVEEHDLLPSLDEKTVSAEEISDVENAECKSAEREEEAR